MPEHKNLADENGLTPQQVKFCHEYIIDLNAAQAAIRAGYSEKGANVKGSNLLAKVSIQEKIRTLNEERLNKTKITAEVVLKELHLLATTDVAECFNEDGTLKEIKQMPPIIRKAISSFEVEEIYERDSSNKKIKVGETKKVKLWSKEKSLESLGKHLKLFTEKVEHSGKLTLEELVMNSIGDDENE